MSPDPSASDGPSGPRQRKLDPVFRRIRCASQEKEPRINPKSASPLFTSEALGGPEAGEVEIEFPERLHHHAFGEKVEGGFHHMDGRERPQFGNRL